MAKQKISILLVFLSCLTAQLVAQSQPLGSEKDYEAGPIVPGTAINPSGIVVVGGSIWTRTGGYQSLGTLGGSSTSAVAINAAGTVVGSSKLPDGTSHAFLWTQSGGMQDLGSVLGGASAAVALNASGQVTGNSWTPDGSVAHAFFWSSNTGMIDLGTLPGDSGSSAVGLNDGGEVVGAGSTAGKVFRWTSANGIQMLPNLGTNSVTVGVSNNGTIGGTSEFADGTRHATVWTADGLAHDLGTLPGDTFSGVSYINAAGHIAGYSGFFARPKRSVGPMYGTFYWSSTTGMRDIGIPHQSQHFPLGLNKQDQILAFWGQPLLWSPTRGFVFANGTKLPFQGTLSDSGLFFAPKQGVERLYSPVMHVQLTSSSNPSIVGQSVTFTAKVNSVFVLPPDGEQVTFTAGTNVLGTVTLSGGTATFSTSSFKPGTHNVIATYGGDDNFASNKSLKVAQIVTK